MHDEDIVDPQAKPVASVAKTPIGEEEHIRYYPTLAQDYDDTRRTTSRLVAEEVHDMRMPTERFTQEDADLVAGQIAGLQGMKDNGMINVTSDLASVTRHSDLFVKGF